MCFPTMQTLSNRGIQDSLHLEAHHSSSASGHLWWSYAEEINFLEGCMLYFMFGTLLSTGLFCWLCLSYFSGTWPTVCCDGIALRGMGINHIYQTVGNHVYNHSWIFQRNKNLYVLAMQWTVELFYEACLLTYKIEHFEIDVSPGLIFYIISLFITISSSHYLKHCYEL